MPNPIKKIKFAKLPFGRKKSSSTPSSEDKLHFVKAIPALVILIIFYIIALVMFNQRPHAINDDQSTFFQGRFIGFYAGRNLEVLTQIGPRLVGSNSNEVQTINFLIEAVERIKNESLSQYTIEYDVQTANGSYIIDDMTNVYQRIKNFVVRIDLSYSNSTSALLLNSHFDTVPESSGSGDDGTMVVVMLEVLRVIVKYVNTLKHPIIFLFNGAEENSLQGSHAFITQHKWAKDIKAFINLDVAGLGGREMVFQSGPGHPWLMKHYFRNALHPYALTIGEEVFQNNLFPSDTDFRIFRDYGKIPGLDMASTYNGYVYHSKYDRLSDSYNIRPSLQNTGDNVLELVKSIASSNELANPEEHAEGHTIFFDFLGLFLIIYSETDAIIINIIVSIGSLIAIALSIWWMCRTTDLSVKFLAKKFAMIFGIQLATVIFSACITIVLAVIIDAANAPLSWFSRPWYIFGLYFCPFAFCMAIVPSFFLNLKNNKGFPLRYGIQLFLHAQCLLLTILIITLTSLSIRSAFAVTITVLFYTVAVIFNLIVRLQSRPFLWLLPIFIGQVLPFAFYSYLSIVLFSTFVPITGRSGLTSQSDLMMAAFTILLGLLMGSFLTPLFSIFRQSKILISGFLLIFVAFAIVIATPLGFPFTNLTSAERHWIFHTQREFHDLNGSLIKSDSGYMLLPLDRYSTISIEDIISNRKYTRTEKDCTNMLVCGVPVYSPDFKPLSNFSYWIEAEPPIIAKEYNARLELIAKRTLNKTVTRFEFEIFGPAHMQIFFNPIEKCQLTKWSLSNCYPKKNYFKESTYFVHFRHGLDNQPFQFYLDFDVPENYKGPIFDIALIAHHNNYPVAHTDQFQNFIENFPHWTCVTPIISSYYSYKF